MLTTSPKAHPAALAVRVTTSSTDVQVRGVQRLGGPALRGDEAFPMGSITKSMTATLAGVLVQEGRIAWTSRVVDVLPELAPLSRSEYAGVTLKDLLAHRGGLAHRNFKRPRGRRSAAGLEGLELAELTPGLLLWPDSTGSRRFARSSFGIDIRVSPWFVGIELTCGAAPPWLRWQRTLVQDSSDGRRGPGGFSPAPPRVPALWVAAADPAPGG
jgi:hypothetical protein